MIYGLFLIMVKNMKNLWKLVVLCLFTIWIVGCSDNDELVSSVKITYNPVVHVGITVSIRPIGASNAIYATTLSAKSNQLIVPLNVGNYEFWAPFSDGVVRCMCGFQVRSKHQPSITFADNFDVSIEY